ncbi:MAG: polymerase [Solirubrobacterales bacterium]|nr:polymerase [Solirubrobacterales bacterium]
MRNAEIANAFDELAVLYELDGAVKYRVLAYRQAARTVRDSPVSVAALATEGRATELRGIGKTLEEKIRVLLETGEIPSAVRLKQKFPPTLIDVTRIPGVGAKTARRLYDELGIATIEDLEAAAKAERLRGIRGLGPKMEERVLAEVAKLTDEGPAERRRIDEVLPMAEQLRDVLRAHPAAGRVEIAGSLRRMTETCKDIDLIATAKDPEALGAVLIANELTDEARSVGVAGASVLTHSGVKIDLRIGSEDAFGNLLQHFSGSAAHNVQLRERALALGFSVSENGIVELESGEVSRHATEQEVYAKLGLAYIEPELREGRGELAAAAAGELPQLVELGDIRGDLHSHTTLSDGHNSLEQMAEAARARGYSYLAVTDHSATHGFGNHVTDAQLAERIEEVRELNAKLRGKRFRVLAGSEVNIGTDGAPDYPDELLAELDWVVASVHTSFSSDERRMTDRVLAAIEHPWVDCIGHLSGRLILRREPYPIDVEKIAEAAARTGTMLEINSNPNRRDLSEHHARLAAEAGVMICINTDAHRVRTMDNIVYGVATARRAWLTADQIANTRPWRSFAPLRKRAKA